MAQEKRVDTRNVNTRRPGPRIAADKYETMKKLILAAVPRSAKGITFDALLRAAEKRAPKGVFAGASPSWYATTVKLDLEARGYLARVPGSSPQRLRRLK